jgi:hypothetical protein
MYGWNRHHCDCVISWRHALANNSHVYMTKEVWTDICVLSRPKTDEWFSRRRFYCNQMAEGLENWYFGGY